MCVYFCNPVLHFLTVVSLWGRVFRFYSGASVL
nr:MAG TPA: hypothetical protein [Caudoviricetes sp.]